MRRPWGCWRFIALMTVTVFINAWPSFSNNSYYKWFLPGGDVDVQLHAIITESRPGHYVYFLRAWPLIWGTILTTGLAVLIGMVFSILAAVFIVEFAPGGLGASSTPSCDCSRECRRSCTG